MDRNFGLFPVRYSELLEKVKKGGGENAILRHTQRNKKLFVRERLRLLLDHEDFLELSPLAGLDMPYGDVPAAACLTGNGIPGSGMLGGTGRGKTGGRRMPGIKFMGYFSI